VSGQLNDKISRAGVDAARRKFTPEFLNRIDKIVVFKPLGEGELRKLVAILIQSDRFGTSMGDSLRTHSDYLRTRRRQEAEERAGKVGVKLVFPIFFFILPSMLIVAAGPGLLQVFKQLFPMMRQLGGQ